VLREFSNGEPAADDDGWVLFADDLSDFHGALVAAGVARPMPTQEQVRQHLTTYWAFATDAEADGFTDAVLALMGGDAK